MWVKWDVPLKWRAWHSHSWKGARHCTKRPYSGSHGPQQAFFQQYFFIPTLTSFFQVSWVRHSDVSLISVGKYQYMKDKRFRVLHEPHAQDWILVIKSVTFADEGMYECQVNTSPILRQGVFLTVVGKWPALTKKWCLHKNRCSWQKKNISLFL